MKNKYLFPLVTTVLCLIWLLVRRLDGFILYYSEIYLAIVLIGVPAFFLGYMLDYAEIDW